MENHSRGQILGNGEAPYINALAAGGATAAGYHDSYVHPSEANYLWMVAGENFDVLDDDDPATPIASTSHIADQLGRLSWKTYQESMGDACGLTSHGRYAAKHDPFVFFSDINGWDGHAPALAGAPRTSSTTRSSMSTSPAPCRYVFITPNLDNDMHDGSIAQGDAWLSQVQDPRHRCVPAWRGALPAVGRGGGTPAGDDPPFIVVSPNAKAGMTSEVDYDTSSYLRRSRRSPACSHLRGR